MNKFALITGGTKGIGKAVAEVLADANYNLILTYGNDDETAAKVQNEFKNRFKSDIFFIKADITQEDAITIIDKFLTEKNIQVNSLIFNAAITARTPFEEITQKEWEQVFYANVHFPVFLLQKIISKIETGGNVLFTGSLMGIYPHSLSLSYGVTKSAVHSLVQNLVKYLAPYKIRINAIAPGFIDTEWHNTKSPELRKSIESKIAVERFCDPLELANIYKTTIENGYLNGEIITVSGGYSYK